MVPSFWVVSPSSCSGSVESSDVSFGGGDSYQAAMIRESFNLFLYILYELTLPYCLSPQRLVDVVSSSERVAIFGNSVAPVIGFPVGKNDPRPKQTLRGSGEDSIVHSGASCTVCTGIIVYRYYRYRDSSISHILSF